MTSATEAGSMAVWDLNSQKLIGQVPQAHSDSITKLYFLCNEPIMVSAGCDNTLKTWIYDMGDKMPRQLILLEGHSKPVSALKFIEGTRFLILYFVFLILYLFYLYHFTILYLFFITKKYYY